MMPAYQEYLWDQPLLAEIGFRFKLSEETSSDTLSSDEKIDLFRC